MYKLFLCLRYLRRRRIAFFAVGAVMLCVAMVLIVDSVMSGFLQMVKDRSRGMLGDLVVENSSLQGFPYYQELIDTIKKEMPDEIAEATPVIISYGVLRFPQDQRTKPAQIVGIKLEETYRVNDFREGLFYETYYPGTTTFAPRSQPYYGIDERGQYALPADLEAARKKWQSTASPDDILSAWRGYGFVFRVPNQGCSSELNRGRIPQSLRQAFSEHFESLPGDARPITLRRDQEWQIRNQGGIYSLQLKTPEDEDPGTTAPELHVYHVQYPGPGYYLSINAMTERDPNSLTPAWGGKERPGAIIGTDMLSKRLSTGGYDRFYPRGTEVQLTFVPFTPSGKISDATGMPSKLFRYVDDQRTGVYDIDSTSVYLDFSVLQPLLQMDEQTLAEEAGGGKEPARATQVQIKLKPEVTRDRARTQAVRSRVQRAWNQIVDAHITDSRHPELLRIVQVLTWEEKQARFIAAVEKERSLVTALFGVISVVAVLLVGCIFYMIVQQKTRDIGIIKSVGATSLGVAGIFLAYGAAVGVVGGALGTALGTVFVHHINEIQELLARFNPNLRVWSPEVYAFDHIPDQVKTIDAVVIYVIAIVASMLGSVIAAYRASRVWPVEALRYE